MTTNTSAPTLLSRAGAIARKEFLHVRRDHLLPRIIILLPIVLLVLFGYALNTSVKNIPLAVVDRADDRVSRALVRAFSAEERFAPNAFASRDAALEAVQAGRARAILEIPDGALETARRERAVPYTVFVDGSDPTLSAQVRAGAGAAGQEVAMQLVAGRALTTPGLSAPLSPTFETLYNPDNRTAVYMVPGLIGLILTQITILLTAIAIVREREIGTMEALIATPVRPLEVILGKVAPYLAFGLLDAAIILGVGVWVFNVPFVGSIWWLALATLLFVLGSLGIGIVISTVTRTQIQAMFGTIAYLFPSIFLSGLLFPLEGMNRFFTAISYAVPLRYYLRVARGVILRGAGLGNLWVDFAALAVFVTLMLTLASLRFRKTL
jgi:ABC-2 type transport system permease protein